MTGFFRGPITGFKFFLIFSSFFVVIIAVNVVMAYKAVSTFPGLEVANSYVASQTFDADRAAQEALGWTVSARTEGTTLVIAITDASGAPVEAKSMDGIFGRATENADDQTPVFAFDGQVYRAPIQAAAGNWDFWIKAVAEDGTPFEQRLSVATGG